MVPNLATVTLALAILAVVTASAAIVVAKVPVPVPVTSPVKVIVWSPVLVPDKFDPDRTPLAATELGVMAPKVRLMAGVLVEVATVPLIPFAVTTETSVTVPPVPVALNVEPVIFNPVPRDNSVIAVEASLLPRIFFTALAF